MTKDGLVMHTGLMRITATEFKAKCLQLIDQVHRTGEEMIISKRGKAVARLVPERPDRPWMSLRGTGRLAGDPFEPVIEESDIEALR